MELENKVNVSTPLKESQIITNHRVPTPTPHPQHTHTHTHTAAITPELILSWGRILGQNPDKSLKSHSPKHLYSFALSFLFSSNSRNLLQFLKRRKEENLIENHTSFPMV